MCRKAQNVQKSTPGFGQYLKETDGKKEREKLCFLKLVSKPVCQVLSASHFRYLHQGQGLSGKRKQHKTPNLGGDKNCGSDKHSMPGDTEFSRTEKKWENPGRGIQPERQEGNTS